MQDQMTYPVIAWTLAHNGAPVSEMSIIELANLVDALLVERRAADPCALAQLIDIDNRLRAARCALRTALNS